MRPRAGRLLALCVAPLVLCLLLLLLVPVIGVLTSIAVTVLLHPFGRTLVERFAVWLLVFLATDAIGFLVAGLRVSAGSAVALLLLGVAVSGGTAAMLPAARGPGTLRGVLPVVGKLDVAVMLAGALEAAWLLRPFVGVGNTGKLARLIVGWDFHTHYVLFADSFQYGRLSDLSIRSSPDFATSAPLLHPNVWALLARAGIAPSANPSRLQLLTPYIVLTAATAAACVALLAWVAAQLTGRLTGADARTWPPLTAAGLFAAYAVLSGPAALFFKGHTPFLLAVTLVVVASNLAENAIGADVGPGLARAVVVVSAATIAIGFEWPPLLLGLGPAGATLLWSFARVGRRQRLITLVALAVGVAIAFPATLVLQRRVGLVALAHAVGGNAAFSVAAATASIPLSILVAFWLVRGGDAATAVCAAGPVLGFTFFAALLIAAGSRWYPVPDYYLLKTLHGVLLAAVPLFIAVVVSASARRWRGPGEGRWHVGTAATVVLAIGVCLLRTPTSTLSAGVPVPLTAASYPTRDAVIVMRASTVTDSDPASLPFDWDTHNLLLNRWIVGLSRPESLVDDSFYLHLMFTPTGGLAELVCGDLVRDPGRRFQVITATPVLTRDWLAGIRDRTCATDRIKISAAPG